MLCTLHKLRIKQGKLVVEQGIVLFDEQLSPKFKCIGMLCEKLMPLGYDESICFLLQSSQDSYDPNYTCLLREFDLTCRSSQKSVKLQ